MVDTATFEFGGTTIALYGVEGVKGEMAEGLQGFLTAHGNRVTCQAQSTDDFVCLQPDGTDVAEVALVNGAARAKPDAPAPTATRKPRHRLHGAGYGPTCHRRQRPVKHPTVPNTATLVADGQTYVLDGYKALAARLPNRCRAISPSTATPWFVIRKACPVTIPACWATVRISPRLPW